MKELENSVALVLGTDAIGAGIAFRFAREGATVALLDDDIDCARRVADDIIAAGGHAIAREIAWDGSVAGHVAAAAEELGGLHVLVNNVLPDAGVAPLEEQTPERVASAFARVQAALAAMQGALPWLKASGRGRIINVGHRYGDAVNDNIGAYNSAAWSLVGLTRTAAMDWGKYQIATNLLLPLADTPEFQACHERRAKVLDLMVSQLALGRVGDPVEDIGGAALYLAGDACNYVNGQIIYADGGQHTAGAALDIGKFPSGTGG